MCCVGLNKKKTSVSAAATASQMRIDMIQFLAKFGHRANLRNIAASTCGVGNSPSFHDVLNEPSAVEKAAHKTEEHQSSRERYPAARQPFHASDRNVFSSSLHKASGL